MFGSRGTLSILSIFNLKIIFLESGPQIVWVTISTMLGAYAYAYVAPDLCWWQVFNVGCKIVTNINHIGAIACNLLIELSYESKILLL